MTGCSILSPAGGRAGQSTSVGAAEAALVFHLIERYPPGDRVVCLRRRTAGDSPEFIDSDARLLEQIRSAGYDAAPGSECRLRDFAGPMQHVPTRRGAVLYETVFLHRLGDRFEFRGAYYAASLDGAGCTYVLTRSEGAYSVTGESDCVVS